MRSPIGLLLGLGLAATGCRPSSEVPSVPPAPVEPIAAHDGEPASAEPPAAAPAPSVAPEPSQAPEPSPDPEPIELSGPPPGLSLEVKATPVRVRGRWVVDLELRAHVTGSEPFDIGSTPAPHLYGEYASGAGFSDGCAADLSLEESQLEPGERRSFTRRFGADDFEHLDEIEAVDLRVGLCNVGLPDGRWLDVPAATVRIENAKSKKGRPKVIVTPAPTAPRAE